ncbi:hypothetical protein PYCCODRAFT_1431278 [Trametes coccinea BRFM310]|uniref:HNH nuclease domain-containing protein n=1 Tax=Trametes coccinea (strain BRFM310) TaxID=1353009 RepID=A0A1Y2J124_TRAC3|nr:hypothetical protein PYCCODRAFT_1431278 [Trametes coccinea BRFM310]
MPALTVAAAAENPAAAAAAVVRQYAHPRDQALLLALLQYAPNDKGRANVAHKIIQCGDSYKSEGDSRCLSQVADFFWRNVILPVRVTGGKTPEPRSRLAQSGMSSAGDVRSPAEAEAINDLKAVIETASVRDSHRCVISGKLDPESIADGPSALSTPGNGLEVTRIAHIIPFSLRDSTSAASGHLPSIWSALECFGGTDLGALMHGGINSLDNVITLSATVHRYFTELQVALDPIPDSPHTYAVRTWGKVAPRLGLPKTVKLTSAAPDTPLPNPAYLALHCAICRVLWASARAEELKDVLDDLEEVALLAADGSSANLINIAIYRSLAFSRVEA